MVLGVPILKHFRVIQHCKIPVPVVTGLTYRGSTGLPRSGKNIWEMNFFPGQGKVKEFCRWSKKFRKDLESQGKVREFENNWLWQAVFRKFIYHGILFKRGKDILSHDIV